MTALPLYAAVVCVAVAVALVTVPAVGLLLAAAGFAGLWYGTQEVDDDDSP